MDYLIVINLNISYRIYFYLKKRLIFLRNLSLVCEKEERIRDKSLERNSFMKIELYHSLRADKCFVRTDIPLSNVV